MAGQISLTAICDAAIKGALNGLAEYYSMSGDNYRNSMPESYFQAKVADEIAKLPNNKYVTLEESYYIVLECVGANANALKRYDKKYTADIVVWSASAIPKYILELKIANNLTGIRDDEKKIRGVLKYEGKLSGGILIGIFYGTNQDKIKQNIEKIRKDVHAVKTKTDIVEHGRTDTDLQNYAGVGVFAIKKK